MGFLIVEPEEKEKGRQVSDNRLVATTVKRQLNERVDR